MVKKRGRHPIKPQILKLVMIEALKDRENGLPKDKWTPRKLVAFQIQKTLREMDEQSPTLETLEKKISEYRNADDFSEDCLWDISALRYPYCDISPQSLPKVIEIFVDKLCKEKVHLTIREAKWIGRFALLPLIIDNMYAAALEYANAEKYAQIFGCNMSDIMEDDSLLLEDMVPALNTGINLQDLRLALKKERNPIDTNSEAYHLVSKGIESLWKESNQKKEPN